MALRVEHDIFVVRQRGREVAALLGLENQDQIRMATALSEVGRQVLRAAGGAEVQFRADSDGGAKRLMSVEIVPAEPVDTDLFAGRQAAAVARLVDSFELEPPERATVLRMSRRIPASAEPLTAQRMATLRAELAGSVPSSALDEMASQSEQLIAALDQVRRAARRARRPQRRARRDQPGSDGALQPALRGAGGDQPGCGGPLRRTRREVGAVARRERGQEPFPGQRQPRAAGAGDRHHGARPAPGRFRLRPAHRGAAPPGGADPYLRRATCSPSSTGCWTWPRRSPAGWSRTGKRWTCAWSSERCAARCVRS